MPGELPDPPKGAADDAHQHRSTYQEGNGWVCEMTPLHAGKIAACQKALKRNPCPCALTVRSASVSG